MAATFEEFISAERERLTKEREVIFDQQQALEEKLQAIIRELAAVEAYENVKTGKAPSSAPSPDVKKRGPTPGTRRASRGEGQTARDRVLALVREHKDSGIKSGDIEAKLSDIKGIPNILTKLAKDGLIQQSARRQPYFPIAPGAMNDDSTSTD